MKAKSKNCSADCQHARFCIFCGNSIVKGDDAYCSPQCKKKMRILGLSVDAADIKWDGEYSFDVWALHHTTEHNPAYPNMCRMYVHGWQKRKHLPV